MTYDPELIDRLVGEARDAFDQLPWPEPSAALHRHLQARVKIFELADQLEAARREVERLSKCMDVAGLQCFMRGGTPEQVAEHMRRVVSSWMENEARLTTERDSAIALRDAAMQRTGGLLAEVGEMRPVVDAAFASYGSQCGDHFGQPRPTDAMLELAAAIDAYRAAKGKT